MQLNRTLLPLTFRPHTIRGRQLRIKGLKSCAKSSRLATANDLSRCQKLVRSAKERHSQHCLIITTISRRMASESSKSGGEEPFLVQFFDPKVATQDFRGRTLDDILSYDDEDLENGHD